MACSDRSLLDSGPVPVNSEVASITFAADSLTLDMRSTVPQTIRFSIVNAAGESLCGRVPVSVQADTFAFTAQLSPTDPCLITLTPRAERSGWLRVQAGAKQVSAPVSVHHRRYRWAFDLLGGTHAAGEILQPSLTAWGESDKPMAGIPVHFGLDLVSADAVTGPDGIARVSIGMPLSTLVTWFGKDSTEVQPPLGIGAWAAGPIQAGANGEVRIMPGAPHHIDFWVYDVSEAEMCNYACTLSSVPLSYVNDAASSCGRGS